MARCQADGAAIAVADQAVVGFNMSYADGNISVAE
jgi:hypothetical protein